MSAFNALRDPSDAHIGSLLSASAKLEKARRLSFEVSESAQVKKAKRLSLQDSNGYYSDRSSVSSSIPSPSGLSYSQEKSTANGAATDAKPKA